MRARLDPRHRWMPSPKAEWRVSARSITNRSAAGDTAGLRIEARVEPDPEARMAVLGPVDHEPVGVGEHGGIAIGGREGQEEPVALAHRTPAAGTFELEVLGHEPGHRHRAVEPEEFLDRGRQE